MVVPFLGLCTIKFYLLYLNFYWNKCRCNTNIGRDNLVCVCKRMRVFEPTNFTRIRPSLGICVILAGIIWCVHHSPWVLSYCRRGHTSHVFGKNGWSMIILGKGEVLTKQEKEANKQISRAFGVMFW